MTESPDMASSLERFTQTIDGLAQRQESVSFSFDLHSDRELSATDPDGLVRATMRDFAVVDVAVEPGWDAETLDPRRLDAARLAAINVVLRAYLEAEFAGLADREISLVEMRDVLQQFTTEFTRASERAWARLEATR